MLPDPEDLIARARAARWEAERLDDLAAHIIVQASLTVAKAREARVSPAALARLHLMVSVPTTIDPASFIDPDTELEAPTPA